MNGRVAQESRVPADETDGRTDQATGKNGKDTNGHAANGKAGAAKADVPVAEAHWSERPIGRVDVPPLGEFTTPVRVDEIAVAAMALSENLDAATRGMPESVALREFRRELDQAASTFRTLAGRLEATAGSLVRLAANDGESCGVGWGVCPDHGLTLMNVGETVSCHILGCNQPNEGAVERCEHPVAYRVVDAAGPALLTCAGHAIACRLYLENPVITAAGDSLELF
ncbi:hypothetical protein ACFCV3_13930 [Kribbella sp. NPDC056345]|uniref:hypothetical protein n=1 Tax=Kribbella sp. NPDC056345 TaxID=3345789 RepID=UPI0035E023B2